MRSPTVLVTGASRGLGRGVALALAGDGYSVAIHYAANAAAAAQTAADCQAVAKFDSQRFPLVGGNIGVAADRAAIFAATLAAFDNHLDALVNNAGITSPGRPDLLEATEAGFDEVLAVNLKGPHFLSQLAARHWVAHPGQSQLSGGYKLVFITSVSAVMASTNRADYCISKAGVAMSSQIFASRLADQGVQVLELRPGIMATDMTSGVTAKYDPIIQSGTVPQRRWGQPQDVGLAVSSFLAGHFPFSTGEVIYLDGGLHLPRL